MLLELLEAIEEFKVKHPKVFKANWKHFQEVLKRSTKITKEVIEYFQRRNRATTCVIALFHNELSRWTRNQICIKVKRDLQSGLLNVRIFKGYKLDKWYAVQVPSGYAYPFNWYSYEVKKMHLEGASDVQTR